MDSIYFSRKNFQLVYEILQKKCQRTHGMDISQEPRFHNELINIMKSVHSNRHTLHYKPGLPPIEESKVLTEKVIDVASQYFHDMISRSKQNPPTRRDNRPLMMSEYSTQTQLRSPQGIPANPQPISFQEPRQHQSNDDVRSRYEQLSKTRESDVASSASPDPFFNPSTQTRRPPNEYSQEPPSPFQYTSPPEVPIHPSTFSQYMNQVQQSANPMPPSRQQYSQPPLSTQFQGNYQATENQEYQNSILKRAMEGDSQTMSAFVPTHLQYSGSSLHMGPQIVMDSTPIQSPNTNTNSTMNHTMVGDAVNIDDMLKQIHPSTGGDSEPTLTFERSFQSKPFSSSETTGHDIPLQSTPVESVYVPNVRPNTIDVNIPDSNLDTTPANSELVVLQNSIRQNQTQLEETNQRIQQLMTIMEKQDIGKFYSTISDIPRLIASQQKQAMTLRTHNLIISSKDRDLSNDEFDKYSFRVVFGAESNQTISGSFSQVSDADRENVRSADRVFTSSGLLVPTIQQVLRNVVSMKLLRVVIPKPSVECYVPEPYLFVSIDEFNSNILSTKQFNNKIFCKIHYDKEVCFGDKTGTYRHYLYYKNDDDDFTMFFASPLGKLDRLTLRLLGSDGEPMREIFHDTDWMKQKDYNYTALNQTLVVDTDAPSNTSVAFSNSLFKGDKCAVYATKTGDTTPTVHRIRVSSVDNVSTSLTSIVPAMYPFNTAGTCKIVNLTNQVEYVIEVKTQELDPSAEVRPTFE